MTVILVILMAVVKVTSATLTLDHHIGPALQPSPDLGVLGEINKIMDDKIGQVYEDMSGVNEDKQMKKIVKEFNDLTEIVNFALEMLRRGGDRARFLEKLRRAIVKLNRRVRKLERNRRAMRVKEIEELVKVLREQIPKFENELNSIN